MEQFTDLSGGKKYNPPAPRERKESRNYYNTLISQIGNLLQQGRRQAAYAVNEILVQTYWQIGKYIVEFEQNGETKAEYGDKYA